MTTARLYQILLMLAGESSVDVSLLAEDRELIALIRNDTHYRELLHHINENY
jgi:hypothetical protein